MIDIGTIDGGMHAPKAETVNCKGCPATGLDADPIALARHMAYACPGVDAETKAALLRIPGVRINNTGKSARTERTGQSQERVTAELRGASMDAERVAEARKIRRSPHRKVAAKRRRKAG